MDNTPNSKKWLISSGILSLPGILEREDRKNIKTLYNRKGIHQRIKDIYNKEVRYISHPKRIAPKTIMRNKKSPYFICSFKLFLLMVAKTIEAKAA